MMELKDFVEQVANFDALRPREKIRLFAWYLHTHRAIQTFDYEAIRDCYKELHLIPDDVSTYIPRMANCSPPDLVIPFPYQIDFAMYGNAVMDLRSAGLRSM